MASHSVSIDPSVFTEPERELTPMQRGFVEAYVTNGGKLKAAALKAGYSPASAAQAASLLIRNPLIQQEITKHTLQAIGLHAAGALHQIARLSSRSKSDYVRLEASRDLLDRAGFKPPDRMQIQLDTDLKVSLDLGPKTLDGGSKTGD